MDRWEILGVRNPFPEEPKKHDGPEYTPAEIADTIMVHYLERQKRDGIGYVAVSLFTRGILTVDEPSIGLNEIERRKAVDTAPKVSVDPPERDDWRERQFEDSR